MLGVCLAEKATEIVFDIADGVRFFPLRQEGLFDERVQDGERTVELLKVTVLGTCAVEGLRQDTDGRFQVFLDMGWKDRSELDLEFGKCHGQLSSQDFFVLNGCQHNTIIPHS
jgi:hypothetical protein